MSQQITFTFNQEQEQFLNIFIGVSNLRKQIWNYLRSIMLKYRQCWPAQETIANALGCCRDTIIQAIKFFKEMGWIGSKKRPYQSNLYFIPDILLKLNTRDQSIYRRNISIPLVKPTQNPTVHNIHRTYKETLSSMEDFERKVFEKRERSWTYAKKEIPFFLKVKILSEEDQQMLANQFSECELLQAIKDTIHDWKKYGKPDNIAAYMTGKCKKYRLKQK